MTETTAYTQEQLEALVLPGDESYIEQPEQEERPRFTIADDGAADWAVRKIAEEKRELDRIATLAEAQIEAIKTKVEKAKRRYEQNTAYLTSLLSSFFETRPHKKTKTTEKYRLLSGTLVRKLGGVKPELDNDKLIEWLKANGREELIKTTTEPRWGELKQELDLSSGLPVIAGTGEIVDGITLTQAPDIFTVDTD